MRIRKINCFVFVALLVIAAYLGFADVQVQNDKLVHFTVFFILTTMFYWLFDAQSTRTIRNLTVVVCTLGGGVISEFIQGLLPYRTFDLWDIACNVGGSLLAVVLSVVYHKKILEKKRQQRYEQLRSSIPEEPEDVNFDMDVESRPSRNDLSRFTSTEDVSQIGDSIRENNKDVELDHLGVD